MNDHAHTLAPPVPAVQPVAPIDLDAVERLPKALGVARRRPISGGFGPNRVIDPLVFLTPPAPGSLLDKLVAAFGPEGATLTELAERLGRSTTTVAVAVIHLHKQCGFGLSIDELGRASLIAHAPREVWSCC